MKKVIFLFIVLCIAGCTSKKSKTVSKPIVVEETKKEGVLQGEVIPIDTALFRYAYRIRVNGDRVAILDLHNPDYYCHLFSYPDFKYLASFAKQGEGPAESIYMDNIRFVDHDRVWVLDDGKNRMRLYGGLSAGKPVEEKDLALDKKLYCAFDFDLKNNLQAIIPDYSGENRFAVADLRTGKLVKKMERIPIADKKLLAKSPSAVAQGWNSFISLSPNKKILVAVTQFGDRVDIYDMTTHAHIAKVGEAGDPAFTVTSEKYGLATSGLCYYDVQVTDKHIYTIFDGRSFKDIMKAGEKYKQGGMVFHVLNHQGELQRAYVLDRPVTGIYVDERLNILYGMDVNADEQIVKYSLGSKNS